MDFIRENIFLKGNTWSGGERKSEVTSWSDGSPWLFDNWKSGQPDNYGDVGVQLQPGYQWVDAPKTNKNFYICQYPL